MTRLMFRSVDGRESVCELTSEVTVGNGPGNAVVLEDPALAERHCRFYLDPQGALWLEDLGSGAGSLLGGQRVSGTVPLPEGAVVTLGSWTVRIEPVPVLVVAGPGAPLAYPLAKDRVVVGSGPTADLLIQHPSVSSRHAQISRLGGALSLLDLGSASGTFVNGPQVSAATIEPGDVLRFGDVEVTFAGAPRKPSLSPPPPLEPEAIVETSPRKGSRWGAVAAAVALVLAIGGVTSFSRGVRPLFLASSETLGGGQTTPDLLNDPALLVRRCTALAEASGEDFDPDLCTLVCTRANQDAPSLGLAEKASRCGTEQRYLRLLRQAKSALSAGKAEEARRLIEQVPMNSALVPRARTVFAEATETLAAGTRRACESDLEGGRHEMAYVDSCRRALELTCNRPEGADETALRWFRRAARESGRGKGSFTCPAEWGAAGRARPAAWDEDWAALRQMYPRPELAEIAAAYLVSGSPREALQLLDAVPAWRVKSPPEDLVSFAANVNSLEIHRHRMRKLLEEAWNPIPLMSDFERLEQAEGLVLPAGLESPLVRDARKALLQLVQARRELAEDAEEAALVFAEHRLDPADEEAAARATLYERAALHALSQRPGCDGVREARAVALPGTKLFEQAAKAAKERGCPVVERKDP